MFRKGYEEVRDIASIKDVEQPLAEIKGSWLKNLYIGEQKYWDIEEDIPTRQIPSTEYVCPSDWRYREDLLWLKYKNLKFGQEWKLRMEVQQRHDRALRQAQNKKLGKKNH